jgi:hypothetical protein
MESSATLNELTNDTIANAIRLYHVLTAQSLKALRGEESPLPEIPVVKGWAKGPTNLVGAHRLGQMIAHSYPLAMGEELAKACGVEHQPSDLAQEAIDKEVRRRLQEAQAGRNQEGHAAWFCERNRNAMIRAIRDLLGADVKLTFRVDGSIEKITRAS